jgi:AcrR family transcriptional regulator
MSPAAIATKSASKGEETRAAILAAAVEQASASGFESLTIGSLAEKTGMSKSGLFAHFGSKLELQIAALDEASRLFTEGVMLPAMKAPRGLKRVQAIFDGWIDWPQRASLPGGCPIDAATREYHHQPGPMRDAIIERQRTLGREISKAVHMAVEGGELKADTDTGQFTYEMFGIILACFRTDLMLGTDEANRRARVAFTRLVAFHRT